MSELLPVHMDHTTHPYLMRLVMAYRPHTPIPSRQELMENEYEQSHHLSMELLTKDIGLEYKSEIKRRS